LDIKRGECASVGDVKSLLIAAEDDAVGEKILALFGDHAFRVGIKKSAAGEVDAAPAVGGQIVENARADTIQRIALAFVGEGFARRREFHDVLVHPSVVDEQDALRVHGDCPSRIRARVSNGDVAFLIELHDIAVVVLRDQDAAVFGPNDAVGIVSDTCRISFHFWPAAITPGISVTV
jgi:hypothetical protein